MAFPCLPPSSSGLVESMSLAQTTRLLASCSKTTGLAVLVNRVDNPVDTRITANSLVLRVDEDDFEIFVGRVLVNPVRIENTQVGATTSDTLLRSRLQGSLILKLVHTLVGGLAISGTLWHWLLASTTADTNTVDDIALLCLVTQTAGFVRARRSRGTVDDVQLSELYYALSARFNECIAETLNVHSVCVRERSSRTRL